MTSSSAPTPTASIATSRALLPFVVGMQCSTPRKAAKLSAKRWFLEGSPVKGPLIAQRPLRSALSISR